MTIYIKSMFALFMMSSASYLFGKTSQAMEVTIACRTPAEIKAGMSAEGYVLVVVANDPKANEARFFYFNPSEKSAYLLFSDAPLGTKPDCVRVQSKWTQAEILDARITQPFVSKNWSKDAAYAEKACIDYGKSECGFIDDLMKQYGEKGLTTYIRGVTKLRSMDGLATGDIILSVLGPTNDSKSGKIIGTLSTGMAFKAFDYSFVGYTDAGINILDTQK